MKKPTKTAKELLDLKKQTGFIAIGPDSSVLDALRLLADRNIGAVLVTEKDHLVGILSERDYARKGELQNRTASATSVRDVMTQNVVSVSPDQTVEECRDPFGEPDTDEAAGGNGIPVANETNGLIRTDDLAALRRPQ